MPKTYFPNAAPVKQSRLPDDVVLSIGKLIRACAEIEDILDLFIGGMAALSETGTYILLGKTAVARRLEIALELATIRTDGALSLHKKAFDPVFDEILYCRNAVAHGVFMGETEHGFAFLTGNPGPIRDASKLRIAVVFPAATIHDFALIATERVPQLEELLEVAERRSERRTRSLLPHNKAPRQASAKRPPQPQS